MRVGGGELTVPEIFRVGIAVAEIIVNKNRRLPRELDPLAAFVASDEVIEPHHVRGRFGELHAVFGTGIARQFPLFGADFPAH